MRQFYWQDGKICYNTLKERRYRRGIMKISKTSYAITGLGAIPPWVVNAGFIVGQPKTLIIDTGMNRLAAQTIHGYAMAVRPHLSVSYLSLTVNLTLITSGAMAISVTWALISMGIRAFSALVQNLQRKKKSTIRVFLMRFAAPSVKPMPFLRVQTSSTPIATRWQVTFLT